MNSKCYPTVTSYGRKTQTTNNELYMYDRYEIPKQTNTFSRFACEFQQAVFMPAADWMEWRNGYIGYISFRYFRLCGERWPCNVFFTYKHAYHIHISQFPDNKILQKVFNWCILSSESTVTVFTKGISI